MLEIIIWDENTNRIQEISKNLAKALQISNKKANVILNSEPPLLARMQLSHRCPVIEINNLYWEYGKNPQTITAEQLVALLNKF